MNVYEAMEKVLPPAPVHYWDICDEAEYMKAIRLWLRTKKKGPMLYPVHGRVMIGKDPFTTFRCRVCGCEGVGDPWNVPRSALPCKWATRGEEHESDWEPMDDHAAVSYLHTFEKPEFVSRLREGL